MRQTTDCHFFGWGVTVPTRLDRSVAPASTHLDRFIPTPLYRVAKVLPLLNRSFLLESVGVFRRSIIMARVCEICGKGRSLGNSVETRGKAKYLGGVGTKITGITRRTFLPNLQNVRTTTPNGTSRTVSVCAQCIRSGAVRKQVRNTPFKVASDVETVGTGKVSASRPTRTKKVAAKTDAKGPQRKKA